MTKTHLVWIVLTLGLTWFGDPRARAHGDEIEIGPLVKQLEQVTQPIAAKPGCDTPPGILSDPADFVFAADNLSWDRKQVCQTPFMVKAFCEASNAGCTKAHGARICWAEQRSTQFARSKSDALKVRIFQSTQAIYDGILKDPALLTQCCHGEATCVEQFKATKLVVTRDGNVSDDNAHYQYPRRRVLVAESRLVNSFNPENIERLLLHELGHACQYALHTATSDDVEDAQALDRTECASDDISRTDFDKALAPDKATPSCIFRSMETAARQYQEQHGARPCFGQWLKEAFADTIFAAHKTRLTHWSWDCATRLDDDHGPRDKLMECMFSRPGFTNALCGVSVN